MSQLKHGNNTATFNSKRRAARANELRNSRDERKHRKTMALDNPNNPKLRRDPGVPDLKQLHSALERRAVAMDTDRKFLRNQAFAQRRVEELERKNARMRGGDAAAAAAANPEGQALTSGLIRDVTNDAKDVASRRHYWGEMTKVVEAADVILEVLDARDPEGCRCRDVERLVQSQLDSTGRRNKRIILVMNKIDLVPHDNLLAWMKHLRREYDTVAFKANTQHQKTARLKQTQHVSKGADADAKTLTHSAAVGAQQLIEHLKNLSRNLNLKQSLTVGVIGFPNVGKSSLINSLTRERRAAVGNMPGLTKSLQTIKLDEHMKIIDSPGVMFSGGRNADGSVDENMVLRNCLRFEQLEDPVGVAYKIVERCTMQQLKDAYALESDFADADQLLFLVAQRRGKLLRGGVPDMDSAAKILIKDWNDGRIEYFSDPPAHEDLVGEATVVEQFAPEIDRRDAAALATALAQKDALVEVDPADQMRVAEKQRMMQELQAFPLGTRTLHADIAAEPASSSSAAAASAVSRPRTMSFEDSSMGHSSAAAAAAAGGFAFATPAAAAADSGAAAPKTLLLQKKREQRRQKEANAAGAHDNSSMEFDDDSGGQPME